MENQENVVIYLDGKIIEWGVFEMRPVMKFSNGMQIVQNVYYLHGKEVYLDGIVQYEDDEEKSKIFLRSKI